MNYEIEKLAREVIVERASEDFDTLFRSIGHCLDYSIARATIKIMQAGAFIVWLINTHEDSQEY